MLKRFCLKGVATLGALGALAFAAAPALAAPVIIYQNVNDDPLAPWVPVPNGVEIGDDLALAGTNRFITSIDVLAYNDIDQSYIGTATGRIYSVDQAGFPATELWSGTIPILNGAGEGNRLLSFAPNVTVPDDIVFSLQFTTSLPATDEHGLGPLLNNVPQVGASEDVYFENTHAPGSDWEPFFFGGNPMANFQLEIRADVPEPGSLAVLAVGMMGLMGMGRRRR
jgi:hypothetical protein